MKAGIFKFANHEYRYILELMKKHAKPDVGVRGTSVPKLEEDFAGPLKAFLLGHRGGSSKGLTFPVYLGGAVHARLIERVAGESSDGPNALQLLNRFDFSCLLGQGDRKLREWMPANHLMIHKKLSDPELREHLIAFFGCIARFLYHAGDTARTNKGKWGKVCREFWEVVAEEMSPESDGQRHSDPERFWAFAPDADTAMRLITEDNQLRLDAPGTDDEHDCPDDDGGVDTQDRRRSGLPQRVRA